jgi:hypothetical protein
MKYLISLCLVTLLVACGGGGGGAADTGNTTTPATATQIQFGNGTFGSAKFSQ